MRIQSESYNAERSRQANELGKWLRRARVAAGLNQKELSASLQGSGVEVSGGCISKWETGEHIPTPYQLYALCDILGDDCPLLGASLLCRFNEEGRQKVTDYIADLSATGLYWLSADGKPAKPAKTSVTMKVYILPASAGTGLALEGEDYEKLIFPAEQVPRGADFGIRVRGDSMLPHFRDGQTVWVKRQKELREGEFGIFILDGEAFIKQLQYDTPTPEETESYGSALTKVAVLQSLNPEYPPRRISPAQRLELAGKVLES